MGENFDLSKRREERHAEEVEKGRQQPQFDFEGKTFFLPWDVPLQVSVIGRHIMAAEGTDEEQNRIAGDGLNRIAHILLRDQYDMFVELGGAGTDVMDLLDHMPEIYGMNEEESGESSASE